MLLQTALNRIFLVLLVFLVSNAAAEVIVLQPDEISGKDAWISDINESYGDLFALMTGRYDFNEHQAYRSFIEFDYSAIPANAQITSASLQMKYYFGDGPNSHYIYRLEGEWDENNVTWENQPEYSDYYGLQEEIGNLWFAWDVTGQVQGAMAGEFPNDGFMLKRTGASDYVMFYSSDYWIPEERPKLVVTYAES